MNEAKKSAYRHLGLTGYTSIVSLISSVKVGLVNFEGKRLNKNIQVAIDVANWLEILMNENITNFEKFNEAEFWEKHSELCQRHQNYGIEVCKEVFEDSHNHASKSS